MSLSSIPYPDHISVRLNGQPLNISSAYPGGAWDGSKDRRWVEIDLPCGLAPGAGDFSVQLTKAGEDEPAGQGGKMITSVELIEYGPEDRYVYAGSKCEGWTDESVGVIGLKGSSVLSPLLQWIAGSPCARLTRRVSCGG
jgi:hypothetical protein